MNDRIQDCRSCIPGIHIIPVHSACFVCPIVGNRAVDNQRAVICSRNTLRQRVGQGCHLVHCARASRPPGRSALRLGHLAPDQDGSSESLGPVIRDEAAQNAGLTRAKQSQASTIEGPIAVNEAPADGRRAIDTKNASPGLELPVFRRHGTAASRVKTEPLKNALRRLALVENGATAVGFPPVNDRSPDRLPTTQVAGSHGDGLAPESDAFTVGPWLNYDHVAVVCGVDGLLYTRVLGGHLKLRRRAVRDEAAADQNGKYPVHKPYLR